MQHPINLICSWKQVSARERDMSPIWCFSYLGLVPFFALNGILVWSRESQKTLQAMRETQVTISPIFLQFKTEPHFLSEHFRLKKYCFLFLLLYGQVKKKPPESSHTESREQYQNGLSRQEIVSFVCRDSDLIIPCGRRLWQSNHNAWPLLLQGQPLVLRFADGQLDRKRLKNPKLLVKRPILLSSLIKIGLAVQI